MARGSQTQRCQIFDLIPNPIAKTCAVHSRDVVLGLGPWIVLKDKITVLGPGLSLEP